MSIQRRIHRLVAEERLRHVVPYPASVAPKRHVFLGSFLHARLHDALKDDSDDAFRLGKVLAQIQQFIRGNQVVLGVDPFDKGAHATMARVAPVELEMFDLRCLAPKPGMRLLGAFSEPDTFIGIHCWQRELMDFNKAVADARVAWNDLFPDHAPYSNQSIEKYVTHNVLLA